MSDCMRPTEDFPQAHREPTPDQVAGEGYTDIRWAAFDLYSLRNSSEEVTPSQVKM